MIQSFKSQYEELNPFGRFFFGMGAASLIVAACMTFKFGWSMSILHAVGLGVLSLVAAFLPEAAYRMAEDGKKVLALCVALCTIPIITVEYFSHVGYTVGQRVENTQQTNVKNDKFDDARVSLTSERTNLDMWRTQLTALQTEAPWIATVKADGLKADLVPIDKSIELETARGGCKSKCQTLLQKKADTEKRIAQAEKSEDLTKRIEAVQRILDTKTETASKQEFESSPVVSQTDFFAKGIAKSLSPSSEVKEATSIGISAGLSLANLLLAPLCFLVAGRNRKTVAELTTDMASHRAAVEPTEPAKEAPGHTVQVIENNRTFTDRATAVAFLKSYQDAFGVSALAA